MAMCEITFNFKFTNVTGDIENHPVKVEVELPESGPMIIDNVEKAILEANKDAIRRAVSTYLEELSKKKPELKEEINKMLFRLTLPPTEWTRK